MYTLVHENLSTASTKQIASSVEFPKRSIQYYCLSEHYPEGIQKESCLFKSYHPNQIAGIDLFIATHENRGQGLGVVIINQFINEFLSHFRLIAVDPNHDNIQAIRCYEKSGFEQSDYSEDPAYCIMLKSIEKR